MAKSKYPELVEPRLEEIRVWARDGVSEEQIAKNLGVAYSTFRKYREEQGALRRVLMESKDYVDNIVVTGAYLKRIKGYDVTETKSEYRYDDDGTRVLVKEVEQVRHIPGDTRAAEFWLANRQPEKWKHKIVQPAGEGDENGSGVVEITKTMEPPEEAET